MILRIVRMEFRADEIHQFHQLFDSKKHHIRSFPGCLHLELHQDASNKRVRYTVSKWESEAALEAYRHSALFKNTWERTKELFAARALAYSLEQIEEVLNFQDF